MNSSKQNKINSIIIQRNATILDALKRMDSTNRKLLLVFDDNNFINVLSIGDIQRAVLRNVPFDRPLIEIVRTKPLLSSINDSIETIKERMFSQRIECMPIVDNQYNLIDVIFWEDIFISETKPISKSFDIPVVIMAGGQGTRLRPITYVLPKALIPIGDKSIIEKIINSFNRYGNHEFYISVNYKSKMIKQYLEDTYCNKLKIKYIEEDFPLGTAGALYKLKNTISGNFFVTNCDILIENDYSEILDFHISSNNDITIVSALKYYSIPYGILETENNGKLIRISEKPELTYQINSGMYILNSSTLDQIPPNKYFDMNQLFDRVIEKGGNIGVYPVPYKSWTDIGDWQQYLNNNIL